VPQLEITECGAACLTMILAYHGHNAPLSEVRERCGVSRSGADALSIARAARHYGLEAEGVRVELDQLGQLTLPAILHWDFEHFVVLEALGRDRATLVDPASGRRRLGLDELGRHFTGVALVLSPSPALQPRPRSRPSLAKYAEIFRRSLPSLLQILAASLGLQVVSLVFPVSTQILLDFVVVPHQPAWLLALAAALAAAVLTRALLALVRTYVVQGLRNALDLTLMNRFLDHLLHLPLAFFSLREAGDLVQRVQSNSTVQNLISGPAISALLDGFLLVGYAGLMLLFNLKLGLLLIGFGLVRVLLLVVFRRRNQLAMTSELTAQGREFGALLEALTCLETTKASGAEGRMVQRWAHRMTDRLNGALERRRNTMLATHSTVFLQGLGMGLVFLVGGDQVIAQQMTLGTFASFLALQSLFMTPLQSLLDTVDRLQYLWNHLDRLDDVLTTSPEPTGHLDPGRLRGEIELRDVSFSHTPGEPSTISDVSVRIGAGEKVAIVGPSGAGKSTLARLLLGLHLPSSGTVSFDGKDLRKLDVKKVRKQMGVVLQETFLFDDTVRANLSLNDGELPLERLRDAARLACVDEVIEALSEGYLSRVGENGALLSGGQRQRLNLARALAHDPAVLLLDEATSSLDLETERRVHANLASVGCTRILIAHRLATVRDADRILVLESGRIVQEGTYDGLLARQGLFRSLVQAREFAHA